MKGSARTEEDALNIAKGLGINVAKIKDTLKNKKSEINAQINSNHELGANIGANGTPAFVIGDDFVSGIIEYDSLKQKIAEQRK
jgi:protein-disulfide isomerase